MKSAYYNEFESYAAEWLVRLAEAGHIAAGTVDGRSIADVRPGELAGYTQCHFFAGLGGWSYTLRLAGWPDSVPVWTGSCPCQPFSSAGKRKGAADERHLWPAWFELIRECRPPVIFGEQVASADGLAWFDAVSSDLENAGYAVGASDLCAAGVGAPHIRQRLYWVAYAVDERRDWLDALLREGCRRFAHHLPEAARCSEAGPVGHADCERTGWDCGAGSCEEGEGGGSRTQTRRVSYNADASGFWSGAEWIQCTDGKARPVEPGVHPLVDGFPSRVGRIRAYGNAIVPQVAATFVRAAMDYLINASP